MLVSKSRFFFLKVAGIRQKDARQVHGRRRRIDRTVEALRDESRQISGVIDVSVREHHRVHRFRIDWRLCPISQAEILCPLKQAAVDKDSLVAGFEKELRS